MFLGLKDVLWFSFMALWSMGFLRAREMSRQEYQKFSDRIEFEVVVSVNNFEEPILEGVIVLFLSPFETEREAV